MDNCLFYPLQGLKGAADQVFPALSQDLHGHILRYHFSLDQLAHKIKLNMGSCRKSHFNLFKSHLYQ